MLLTNVAYVCSGALLANGFAGAPSRTEFSMSTELVEVTRVLAHGPELVWQVVSDPALYPRFVREVAWSERVGHLPLGSGARYRLRFSVERSAPVEDEIEILVHRPPEHLVLVSPQWQGG